MKPNFFRIFFRWNCSQGFCPTFSLSKGFSYLFSVLRKVSNKLGKNGKMACLVSERAETFNGLQKVLQILCIPGPTTLWIYPVSNEDILMEDLKRWRKVFLRKMKKCIFGRNPKASYFMTETMIVQKVAYILASLCEGEWFSYLFSVLRKISYKLEKKWKKFRKIFSFIYLLKKSRAKKFRHHCSLKCSLCKPRKINETMNAIFGLSHEIYELK